MKTVTFFRIFMLIIPFFSISQNYNILCSTSSERFKITDVDNVPVITTNNGSDTITLTWQDQYITDIFANYDVYDFYRTFPTSTSSELLKFYTVEFDSKNLIVDLQSVVPNTELFFENIYDNIPISNELSSFLDGKHFKLKKYNETSDISDCTINCPLIEVPSDFNFTVSFDYDSSSEQLHMQSTDISSCGNSFSIGLKRGQAYGGNSNNLDSTVQLWSYTPNAITSTPSNYSQDCHTIENVFYSLFGMACGSNTIGSIQVTIDIDNNAILFNRENGIFGELNVYLEEYYLSVDEFVLNSIKLFEIDGNPYLQMTNIKKPDLHLEIYSLSGQQILKRTIFKKNEIDISNLQANLYFVKIFNSNNNHKVYKFLKK